MLEIGKREILNTDIELLDLYWDSSARVPRWKCLYHCKTHESGVMECELTTLREVGHEATWMSKVFQDANYFDSISVPTFVLSPSNPATTMSRTPKA